MKKEEIETKLKELQRLMLGLNAYGSLELTDYNLIINQIESAFKIKLSEE